MKRARNLIFVLGDQLSLSLSSFDDADPKHDVIVMCEVMEEASYVHHHKLKIALIFSAMRHFAAELQDRGFYVRYTKLDDPDNSGSFTGELKRAVETLRPRRIVITEGSEWRVLEEMGKWHETIGVSVEIRTDGRYLCSKAEFQDWARDRRSLTMEYFYRDMRRRTRLLMSGTDPEGGRWNFDAENRKPAKPDLLRPRHPLYRPDKTTTEVLGLVERTFPKNMGSTANFSFAVTRADAEGAARTFMKEFLPNFGESQDAMLSEDPFLNHALLSFYINIGLLDPLNLCRQAERAYIEGDAPLNAVEGFIRQIIGWREFIRGIYWLKMPGYEKSNVFEAHRPLPEFFWTGDTDMACVSDVITKTITHAYAHHIQRLMVVGNFSMLAGLNPFEVHQWYLSVYADAFEWVELPNVIGMSQFADGGFMASKPYAASGAYISRMSDYCNGCRYKVAKKIGDDACPFNSLYWDFMDRNAAGLSKNHRLSQVLSTWRRMDEDKRHTYRQSAAAFLKKLDNRERV
ncbi:MULTISPECIES: cryptochrome/photolyase family protein [unclassified Rhizobium]|uniref:cryptochrome/photolyase family protein n=1 Tax=unclassified Rhizobium TaxID=2613769 RepID=UPI0016104B20|nr:MULTISPECIES: cryptochrome/photolyase family protein [unclassified Rhizobium]MBB3545374.1 deoxyribodipyrimidine photolyase-related protein [Rhizobium sp. BK399]MCS4096302.1 deoxyribodipyrimidine photolyase-related protein [Rhizobium sp. BK176]